MKHVFFTKKGEWGGKIFRYEEYVRPLEVKQCLPAHASAHDQGEAPAVRLRAPTVVVAAAVVVLNVTASVAK